MILFAIGLLALSDPAPQAAAAQPDGKQAATTTAKPTDADSRIVCQYVQRTGTRLPSKRYCMTAFEWRMMAEGAKRDVSDLQRKSQVESGPSF